MLKSMSGRGSIFFAGAYLGNKLQEEAEFADFRRLFHNVYAVEVVQHDRL